MHMDNSLQVHGTVAVTLPYATEIVKPGSTGRVVTLCLGFDCLVLLAIALVVPNCACGGSDARIKLAQFQIGPASALSLAIQQYHEDLGRWPAQLSDLIDRPTDEASAARWAGYL